MIPVEVFEECDADRSAASEYTEYKSSERCSCVDVFFCGREDLQREISQDPKVLQVSRLT